jgi:DNA segregation ATPase FtsK/SpoIIIE-like protein
MQGCFVSPDELNGIIAYWQGARRAAISPAQPVKDAADSDEVPEIEAEPPEQPQQPLWEEMRESEEEAAKYSDELLPEAIATVRQLEKASTSLLQRRFRIGYTRAARLMDTMEEDGIIGPPTGTSKARKVLPYAEQSELEEFGEQQD